MSCRNFWILLSLNVSIMTVAFAQMNLPISFRPIIEAEMKPFFPLSNGQLEDILKGEVVSEGQVKSPNDKEQSMELVVAGMHPRNCTRAMRKLSLYENYKNYMEFVKESTYDDKTQRISLTLDHALLPFPMIVGFKIPRITKEGRYPFTFENGFLKDLKGTVIVKEAGKFCLLGLKTDWQGPQTKIPNVVFETFVQTVGRMGLEHLIRVSRL
jgi:hypothetical protein